MASELKSESQETNDSDPENDSLSCDVCKLTFEIPKAYYSHIYSVSHLQRANAADKQMASADVTLQASPTAVTAASASNACTISEAIVSTVASGATGSTEIITNAHIATDSSMNSSLLPNALENMTRPDQLHMSVSTEMALEHRVSPRVVLEEDLSAYPVPTSINTMVENLSVDTFVASNVLKSSTSLPATKTADGAVGNMTDMLLEEDQTQLPKSMEIVAPGLQNDVSSRDVSQSLETPVSPVFSSTGLSPELSRPVVSKALSVSGMTAIGVEKVPLLTETSASTASHFSRTPTSKQPLLLNPCSAVKTPLLMHSPGNSNCKSSGGNLEPCFLSNAGVTEQVRTAVSAGMKIPLLPPPSSAAISSSAQFLTSQPIAGGAYHSGPLLPTPGPSLTRGPVRPARDVPFPAPSGCRQPLLRHWDLNEHDHPPRGGVEVKDYHHGFQPDAAESGFHSQQTATVSQQNYAVFDRQVKPLTPGKWIMKPKQLETCGRTYSCHVCSIQFDELVLHRIHLAGLRHQRMVQGVARKPTVSDVRSIPSFSTAFDAEEDMETATNSPAFVTGLLDPSHSRASAGVPLSSSSSAGCFSELEKKLQSHPGPILGADYVTEYRYLGGRLEYLCNLCDTDLSSVSEVVDHVSHTDHLLQYMFYNDMESYKMVTEKEVTDSENVKRAAGKIAGSFGKQNRIRVKLESDDVLDGRFTWIELKDDAVKSVSALPGHCLSCEYSTLRPTKATRSVKDLDMLLKSLAIHSCLLENRPPSLARPLRRIDFLTALGKFEIHSSKDAEVCLQLANYLTIAVINYRRQMLPSLNAVDVTKVEQKLKSLHHNAQAVAEKTLADQLSSDIGLAQPDSNKEAIR